MALLRGYLYVLADEGRQFAKIGMSRDADSCVQSAQPHCPLKLAVEGMFRCTYARYREAFLRNELKDLHLHGEWFKWDWPKINDAISAALRLSDSVIKPALPKRQSLDYPVRRTDTGEEFENAKHAAMAVLGDKSLAARIRKAVREGVKCGPTFWTRV
jgi:hypothetical protein